MKFCLGDAVGERYPQNAARKKKYPQTINPALFGRRCGEHGWRYSVAMFLSDDFDAALYEHIARFTKDLTRQNKSGNVSNPLVKDFNFLKLCNIKYMFHF
jgi:hypothetical protein